MTQLVPADHLDPSSRAFQPGADRRAPFLGIFRLLLLVEGNATHRLQIANDLLDEGYEVVEADHPGEAMSILKGRNDFDGMITDVRFGGRSADLALIRYMAVERKNTKVLVVSDLDEEETAITATGAYFLKRPCTTKALLRSVEEMLTEHRDQCDD
jgi:DNA-binding response OmpR family regulator